MGIYLDPKDKSKEQFLADAGVRIHADHAGSILASGTHLPVCLVDNGGWTAAAVVYDELELARISDAHGRQVEWWSVPRARLFEAAPELKLCFPEE